MANEKILLAIQFIKQHVCENLTVNKVAASVFLSPRHFQRLFVEYTGTPPARYINQEKSARALELLQKPELKVKEIAYLLGYTNYETFSIRFKEQYGISPGDLRNILHSIRLKRNETRNNLEFYVFASCSKNIPMELKELQASMDSGDEKYEVYIATKCNGQNRIPAGRLKYKLLQYEV